jgi:cytochrome c556
MRFHRTLLTATVALCAAGALFAAEATNQTVIDRQALMKEMGGGAKVLGDMAKGVTPFDADAASAAIALLTGKANLITDAFAANETDPESEALPAIWESPGDFAAKADDLFKAALSADVQASLQVIGGACGTCHKAYRQAD